MIYSDMLYFVENIGGKGLQSALSFKDAMSFSYLILARLFDRRAYNSAVSMVLLNQIYFTAVQILPLFLTAAICLSIAFVGIIGEYLLSIGLFSLFGPLLVNFMIAEIAPFATVLLIALRSSSAINAEIAVMKVNKELNTLEVFQIDIINYLFLPRVIAGIVSVVLLTCLFAVVIVVCGLIYSGFFFNMSARDYIATLLESAGFFDLIAMTVKSAVFGFFIVMIPIRHGTRATDELTSIPVAVRHGMVNVFIAIVIIEVLSLVVTPMISKLI
ncbi:MAG: ABC transporter permease [Pseudomonadota bacterium]|nr:ABC transporter permease [Pseudomonadota bacterium]